MFNDYGLLNNVLSDIYPNEMIVNNTNISARKCCYLDLNISIYLLIALTTKGKLLTQTKMLKPFLKMKQCQGFGKDF